MGCHQSKVEEQVQVPASNDAVVETEVAVAPIEAVEPAVEVVAAPVEETSALVEEADSVSAEPVQAEEAAAPAEERPAVEVPPASTVSEVTSTDAVASETPAEVVEVAEEPVAAEPVAEEPAAPAVTEPEVETAPVEEPKEEVESSVSFTSGGIITDNSVVFYQFTLVDKEDPAKDLTIRKRFNDFKVLHEQVAKLMASEANVPTSQNGKFATYPALPPLPKSGMGSVLFGRRNKNLTTEREAQFGKILNAIVRHPVAYESDAVKAFLA